MSHSVARRLLCYFPMTFSPACSTTHKQGRRSLSKDVRPLMALCARDPCLQGHPIQGLTREQKAKVRTLVSRTMHPASA